MKYAGFWFVSVVLINGFKNTEMVADQRWNIVICAWANSIPAVVSEVEDDEVEILGEQ